MDAASLSNISMCVILNITFSAKCSSQVAGESFRLSDTLITPVESRTTRLLDKVQSQYNPYPSGNSSQDSLINKPSSFDKKRVLLVAGTHIVLWAGTYTALNKAWYKGYPKSNFHFFNDMNEWNGMDKAGHVWAAYQLSKASAQSWAFAGMNKKKSVIYGSVSGLAFQSIIEIQDGFSSQWGFSWGDMTANTLGAVAFAVQELTWKQQNIQIKFSYYPLKYPDDLVERRNQLFGKAFAERILKDYNSQTYWLSINLKSVTGWSVLPGWLNIATGYSAKGMLGAVNNRWTNDGINYDRTDIKRIKNWLLSFDADLTEIKTKSGLLKTVLGLFNSIKVPFPALEYNSNGKLKIHAMHF
jgi:uncharacterized protein YfiM (DUF2279 family)